MSKIVDEINWNPLVIHKGLQNVLVNHKTLDSLMGRLMEMCELNGDLEQRNALKRSIKAITRDWLRAEYENAGSGLFGELKEYATLYELKELPKVVQDKEKTNYNSGSIDAEIMNK